MPEMITKSEAYEFNILILTETELKLKAIDLLEDEDLECTNKGKHQLTA